MPGAHILVDWKCNTLIVLSTRTEKFLEGCEIFLPF